MIARVVVLPAIGDSRVLDYLLGDLPAEQVQPGTRVLVPLRGRHVVALVVEVAMQSQVAELKTLRAVLDPQPVLDAALLQLCRWTADYYLSSFAEAVGNALPGSVHIRVEESVRLSERAAPLAEHPDGRGGSRARRTRAAEILAWLSAHGAQTKRVLVRRFGPAAGRAVAALQERPGIG